MIELFLSDVRNRDIIAPIMSYFNYGDLVDICRLSKTIHNITLRYFNNNIDAICKMITLRGAQSYVIKSPKIIYYHNFISFNQDKFKLLRDYISNHTNTIVLLHISSIIEKRNIALKLNQMKPLVSLKYLEVRGVRLRVEAYNVPNVESIITDNEFDMSTLKSLTTFSTSSARLDDNIRSIYVTKFIDICAHGRFKDITNCLDLLTKKYPNLKYVKFTSMIVCSSFEYIEIPQNDLKCYPNILEVSIQFISKSDLIKKSPEIANMFKITFPNAHINLF